MSIVSSAAVGIRALVTVLIARFVVPTTEAIDIRIGSGLLDFMRQAAYNVVCSNIIVCGYVLQGAEEACGREPRRSEVVGVRDGRNLDDLAIAPVIRRRARPGLGFVGRAV